MRVRSVRWRRLLRCVVFSIFSATAVAMTPGALAAPAASAAVAGKLVAGSDLSRLWADPAARAPVIIQFAMPTLADAASFASPDLADAAQISAIHAAQDAILADFLGSASEIAKAEASGSLNIKRMDFSPVFGISVTAAELEKLAANSKVTGVQEDGLAAPTLIESLPLIQMPAAYAAGATGNGKYVAVLDTGARRSHEFLSARILRAACFSSTNAGQQSTSYCPGGVQQSTDIDSANDCNEAQYAGCGHGTHTNGTAAGFNTAPSAGEPPNGVARDGRLLSINVFSLFPPSICGSNSGPSGCVLSFTTDQIRGLEHVFSLRNTISLAAASMSLGGGRSAVACDSDSRKAIIDQLRAANIATVIAAGNNGFNTEVSFPGCVSSAITVASTTKQDARSSFSNWGTLIDVAAPGSSILASYVSGNSNTFYASLSGTSMATPHVAGAFAALRTAKPNATVSQIEAALEGSGVCIFNSGQSVPRIRVNSALGILNGAAPGPCLPPPGPANDNFANRINIPGPGTVTGVNSGATAEAGEPLHFNLSGARNSVWWRFTPQSSGQIIIDTEGSNLDTVLAIYTGSAVNALTSVIADDDSGTGLLSRVQFNGTANTQYQIAVAGFNGATGNITLHVAGGGAAPAPNILSSVLPAARPATVGNVVTALATVINAGNATATACTIALPPGTQNINFSFRTVANNGQLGPVNGPVDIPGNNGAQNFVMGFTPTAVQTTTIALVFDCTNSNPAPSVPGLNQFRLTATATPTADIITTAATSPTPGLMDVPLGGTGASSVASINIGASATVRAQMAANAPGAPAATLPGTMRICRTNSQAQCITPLTNSFVDYTATANQSATFSAFFISNGTAIPFDPANKRLFINYTQGSTVVGSTSVAIRTVAAPDLSVSAANAN